MSEHYLTERECRGFQSHACCSLSLAFRHARKLPARCPGKESSNRPTARHMSKWACLSEGIGSPPKWAVFLLVSFSNKPSVKNNPNDKHMFTQYPSTQTHTNTPWGKTKTDQNRRCVWSGVAACHLLGMEMKLSMKGYIQEKALIHAFAGSLSHPFLKPRTSLGPQGCFPPKNRPRAESGHWGVYPYNVYSV